MALWGRGRLSSEMTFVSRRYTTLLEHRGRPSTPLALRRYRDLGSWRLCEEQLFESRLRALEPAPLLERDQDGGLYALLSDDLRTFVEARLQQFAEVCLRVLDRPPSCG